MAKGFPSALHDDSPRRTQRARRAATSAANAPLRGYGVEQTGCAPQAIPCASNAAQMRQALGVPFARLPSSSSTGRYTVYQLVAAHPSTDADGLQVPPEASRYALLLGVRLPYQMSSISAQPTFLPCRFTRFCARSQLEPL